MFRNLITSLIILSLGSISAQSFKPEITNFHSPAPGTAVEDTVRILGIMVNFQEDKDAATFGNGKFGSIYTKSYGNSILDPLPHDKAYFESHLEFVKNYYNKVTGNKLYIEYYIFPDTFSVSKAMRNYSPPKNSTDFTLIASFAEEVWTKVDSIYPRFDFSHYNLFSIFHAGVGRDITLPGSLGNEKDLPSVYLSLNALKGIYGEEFEGFELTNNSFNVPNTMIIPETESRELSSFNTTFLFEITINGLLAASVASHLGLPDLFDTNTGLSAIGRFGLMDGQSIFAYSGVFPPEPSPWEKIKLGELLEKDIVDVVELEPGDYDLNLVADEAAGLSDTVIVKIPINASEYFLIENRRRDANNDGAVLTYIMGGDTLTRVYTKDTTGFYSFAVDSVDGVVINVDEYDWAVPGNGIVIWHIDENIINEKISENKINTDKFNRGVDVEEADGIQDIGEKFLTIFGDEVIGEGTEQDFWYSGNEADLYKNIFSKDTRPDTKSNKGANSLITMRDFSDVSNRMNFKVTFGDSIVKPIFAAEINDLASGSNSLTVIDSSGVPTFGLLNNSTLYLISDSGKAKSIIPGMSNYKPAAFTWGGENYFIGALNSSFRIYKADGSPVTGDVTVSGEITAPPVIRKTPTEEYSLLIGTSKGRVYIYSLSSLPAGNPMLSDSLVFPVNFPIPVIRIAADGLFISAAAKESINLMFFDGTNSYSLQDSVLYDFAVTKNQNGEYVSIVLGYYGFYALSDGTVDKINIHTDSILTSFSLADIKQDGNNYIIYNAGKIYAVNPSGILADNFPFDDPEGIGFVGLPLAVNIAGDEKAEIIANTADGRIFAIDGGTGRVIEEFPLSTGGELNSVPAVFNYRGKISLAALSSRNSLFSWTISPITGTGNWTEAMGNNMNTAFTGSASRTSYTSEFFPSDKAYNYPNPVYQGETYIRYYVSETSKINIKIFDLAGDFVAEINDDAEGGMDNESTWNVKGIQSGIYLARVEATSVSGRSESTVIKIAVVK